MKRPSNDIPMMKIPASWIERLRHRHSRVDLRLVSGETLALSCPVGRGDAGGRGFVFALHKSGSVLLNGIVSDLARAAGAPNCNVPEVLFRKGVKWKDVAAVPPDLFGRKGVIFSGFRRMPRAPFEIGFGAGDRAALLVRDPRDILVSLYFSIKFSHSIPKDGGMRDRLVELRKEAEQTLIDDYVIDGAPRLARQYDLYREGLMGRGDSVLRVFRYEDVIFEKERWVADLADLFGFAVPEAKRRKIAARYDLVPEKEDPSSHVRRVAPGDHREKLSPATIAKLDEIFRETVAPFGYAL
jgi:hypothetical protein